MSTGQRDVARMLAGYSRRVVETWARARGLDPQKLRGNVLEKELAGVLLAPASLKTALAGTTREEQIVLARLKEAGGKSPAQEVKAQLVIDGVKDPDAIFAGLMSRGLLFYDRSMEGYYGRWELWGGAQQGFTPPLWLPTEISERVTIPEGLGHLPLEAAAPPPRVREGSFATLQRDLYLLLQALRENPVKLLKSGGVSKRDSERLLKLLPTSGGEGDPTTKARAEGVWFHFLWFLVQHAELLREDSGRMTVSPAGVQFLGQSEAQQALILLRAWARMPEWDEFRRVPTIEYEFPGSKDVQALGTSGFDYVVGGYGDAPSPPQLVMGRLNLMELLLRQEPYPGWHSFPSLLQSMKRFRVNFLIPRSDVSQFMPWGMRGGKEERRYRGFHARGSSPRRHFDKDRDWDQVEGAFLRTLLEESLLWLGIVRLGYQGEELVSFELTERGAVAIGLIQQPAAGKPETESRPDGRALVVQPNFEVVVYSEVAGIPLLVELDRFAERVRMDRAALYRLTRADLCRGLQEGLTLAGILRMLETANAGPLPQNVAYSLEEWERLFNRIQVRRSVALIEAADDAELRALRALPELKDAREVAPLVLLLPPGADARRLRQKAEPLSYTAPIVDALEFQSATRLRVLPGALNPRLRHRLLQIADPVENGHQHEDAKTRRGTRKGKQGTENSGEAPPGMTSDSAADSSTDSFASSRLGVDSVLQLTQEKVASAARWWKWEAMHQFLVSAAKTKPPAELGVILKGWAGELAPAAVTGVTLLAAPSAEWLEQVMGVPEVKPLILHRLSPTLALVTEENRPRLDAALDAIGVATGDASLERLITAADKADSEAGEFMLVGPPRKRRALVEQAVAQRRRIEIADAAYTGTGRLNRIKLEPLRIEGEGAAAQLVARTEGHRYEYRYSLNRIQAVRMLDETFTP